jgi:hypothetical protein
MFCNFSGCVGNVNPQLADWLCLKCEKTKKPQAILKAKRPIAGGTEKEDAKMRWVYKRKMTMVTLLRVIFDNEERVLSFPTSF